MVMWEHQSLVEYTVDDSGEVQSKDFVDSWVTLNRTSGMNLLIYSKTLQETASRSCDHATCVCHCAI